MAFQLESTIKRYIGTSADAKPVVGGNDFDDSTISSNDLPPGSSFLETDTGRIYRWDGSYWTHDGGDNLADKLDEILRVLVEIRDHQVEAATALLS